MQFIAQEQELGRELPRVIGNVDFQTYQDQLERIEHWLVEVGWLASHRAASLRAALVTGTPTGSQLEPSGRFS